MLLISNIFIGVLALLHFYIMIIEMFMWDKQKGLKAFDLEKEFATSTKIMAANQGLYNGFLAAGLVLGLISSLSIITYFFLICILIAGIYGGITYNKKIIVIQAIPATIGLVLHLLS